MGDTNSKYCNCLYFSANALGRSMTRMAEEEFAMTGLSPSHGILLVTVINSPGIQPSELSAIMELSPSTVTRLIEKLEQKNYVERKTQGRSTEVYPLPDAKKAEKLIKLAWKNLKSRYDDLLGMDTAKSLANEVYSASKALST